MHTQCDVCLRRVCHGIGKVPYYGKIKACYSCVVRAVNWAHKTATSWGGDYGQDKCGMKDTKVNAIS